MTKWIIGIACWVAVASLLSFGCYALDKWRAVKGHSRNRIPESTLHWIDLFGGWPGGWLARNRLRHKSQKVSFRIVFWITVALNLAIGVALVWILNRWIGQPG